MDMQELREYHAEFTALEENQSEIEINTTAITAVKGGSATLLPRMAGNVETMIDVGQKRLTKEDTAKEVALSGKDEECFRR